MKTIAEQILEAFAGIDTAAAANRQVLIVGVQLAGGEVVSRTERTITWAFRDQSHLTVRVSQ